MVVCAHGSTLKASSPAYIHIDPGQIASIFPPLLAWAVPFAPYIPSIDLDVGAFCALEPPELPTIDAFDIAALLTGGRVGAALLAAQKFTQLTEAYLWYQLCTCVTDATPAAPTAPSAPANLPAINPPGIVSQPSTTPCMIADGGPVTVHYADTGQRVMLPYTTGQYLPVVPPWVPSIPLPSGATYYTYRITNSRAPTGNPNDKGTASISWINGSQQLIRQDGGGPIAPGATLTIQGTVPAGSVAVLSGTYVQLGFADEIMSAHLEVFCGALPGQTQSPCCPPDPVMMAQINQILEAITLIQRQSVPFAYINGPVHAGLSGQGTITTSGLLGVSVDLTTTPGRVGSIDGAPDTLFDVGWLNFGNAGGSGRRIFVTSDPFVYFPQSAGMLTKIGYTFPADVVATITELRREF